MELSKRLERETEIKKKKAQHYFPPLTFVSVDDAKQSQDSAPDMPSCQYWVSSLELVLSYTA